MVEIKVDPKKQFKNELKKAQKKVGDLRIPLTEITKRWYKSNQFIFMLNGPGKYEELSDRYSQRKQKTVGFTYPVLEGKNKRIKKAITDPGDSNAYNSIVKKSSLFLGVIKSAKFKYPAVHHLGYPQKNIPARPFLLTGAEQVAPRGIQKSVEIYTKIIRDYVFNVAGGK